MKKTWKKISALGLCAILAATGLTACASSASETAAEKVSQEDKKEAQDGAPAEFPEMTIKLGHGSSPAEDDPYHILATNFAKNVSDATGGRVTIEIFPSGQLGGEMDSYEGLGMGTVDMCIATANIFGLYYDKTTIMDLPFLFEDQEAAQKLLDSELMARIMEELSGKTNAVHLGWGEGGFRQTFNNIRPIRTPADLKGIKLRVPETKIFVDTFSALGANVTPMTYSETYTGLQQKTIDGIEVPIGNGYTVGFYEVCKYLSLTQHFYNAFSISISKSLYDGMSPELQTVLRESAGKAGQDQRLAVRENEKKQLEKMEEARIEVNKIEDVNTFRTMVQPIYDNYKNKIDSEIYVQAMEILGIDK